MPVWSRMKSWVTPVVLLGVICVAAAGVATERSLAKAHTKSTMGNMTKVLTPAQAQAAAMVDPGTPLFGNAAPDFTLTDQFGKQVSLSQFRGKVVVLSFVDSQCTTICPLTTQDMVDAVRMLGPQAAKDIQLLGIDANPDAISINDVMQYSTSHNMLHSWHFLTGTLPELKKMWHSYAIEDQIVNGQIDHTPALYVIDPKGREQVVYLTPSTYSSVSAETAILAKDIEKYLPASDRSNLQTVAPEAVTNTTKTPVTLPTIAQNGQQGKVTLGPGSPTLTVFFASWAPNAKSGLQEISQYAQRTYMPRVVGVDVSTTEPSLDWGNRWTSELTGVAIPLAVDQTGKVADAYHVQDLMWMTLTDKAGKVLWSHDGWLPINQLQKIVQAKMAG